MGASTKGYISTEISLNNIFNVVLTKYDKNATMDAETKEYSEDYKVEYASIFFKNGENNRRLWVYRDLNRKEDTSLDLGYWNNSVDIMIDIVKSFGGKVKENDYLDIDPVDIPKDENYSHSDRAKLLYLIIEKLDEKLGITQRTNIASQIIKHKEAIKELL